MRSPFETTAGQASHILKRDVTNIVDIYDFLEHQVKLSQSIIDFTTILIEFPILNHIEFDRFLMLEGCEILNFNAIRGLLLIDRIL